MTRARIAGLLTAAFLAGGGAWSARSSWLGAEAAGLASRPAGKEQKARRLIELTGGKELELGILASAIDRAGSFPSLPPDFAARFRALAAKNDVLSRLVPIYAKHLTEPDLDAAIAWFDSPAGRNFHAAQPAIIAETQAAGEAWAREIMEQAVAGDGGASSKDGSAPKRRPSPAKAKP